MAGDRIGSGSIWGRWNNSASLTVHPGAYACLHALGQAAARFLTRKVRKGVKRDTNESFARYLAGCRRINTAPCSPRDPFRKEI